MAFVPQNIELKMYFTQKARSRMMSGMGGKNKISFFAFGDSDIYYELTDDGDITVVDGQLPISIVPPEYNYPVPDITGDDIDCILSVSQSFESNGINNFVSTNYRPTIKK